MPGIRVVSAKIYGKMSLEQVVGVSQPGYIEEEPTGRGPKVNLSVIHFFNHKNNIITL